MRHTLNVIKLRVMRSWWLILLVSILGTGASYGVKALDLFGINDAENGAMDSGMQFWFARSKTEPAPHTALVAIDQYSFDRIAKNPSYARQFGSWPYQRTLWARVFTELTALGARAIVFDATLTESQSDPTQDENLRSAIADGKLPVYLAFGVQSEGLRLPKVNAVNRPLGPDASAQGRHAEKKARPASTSAPTPRKPTGEKKPAPAPAEGGAQSFEDAFGSGAAAASPEEQERARLTHVAEALAFPVRTQDFALLGFSQTKAGISPPIDAMLDACPGYGLDNQEEDSDGRMRLTRFAYTDGQNAYVTLGVAVVADLLHAKDILLSPGKLTIGPRTYRLNPDSSGRLRYDGAYPQRYPVITPLVDVLDSSVDREKKRGQTRLDPARFKGRVVLVGGFANGTNDMKLTPVDGQAPGVIKHAADIESLLGDGFIVDASALVSFLLTLGVSLLSAAVIMVVKSPVLEIGFPIALFFLFYLLPGFILVHGHLHLLSAVPSMAGSVASVAATVSNHVFAEHDRERYRETFSRYMERGLVDQLVEGRELPPLDGVTQPVTAFFSDIRGFSTFSEAFKDDPKQLMQILNAYLTRVTHVLVVDHQATLDKYVGDSVIALFNAPLVQPDHALRACRAALAVQREIHALREEFRQKGWPDVYTRIGVNTGLMTVGNLGSEQLVDYTAIGDEMNLASRLEGANKAYGTLILIGPGTYEAVKDALEVRPLDRARVPGKHEPVRLYELAAEKGALSDAQRAAHAAYARGLASFEQGELAAARAALDEALQALPEDGPSLALKERCAAAEQRPPGTPFDPVHQLHK